MEENIKDLNNTIMKYENDLSDMKSMIVNQEKIYSIVNQEKGDLIIENEKLRNSINQLFIEYDKLRNGHKKSQEDNIELRNNQNEFDVKKGKCYQWK